MCAPCPKILRPTILDFVSGHNPRTRQGKCSSSVRCQNSGFHITPWCDVSGTRLSSFVLNAICPPRLSFRNPRAKDGPRKVCLTVVKSGVEGSSEWEQVDGGRQSGSKLRGRKSGSKLRGCQSESKLTGVVKVGEVKGSLQREQVDGGRQSGRSSGVVGGP